MTKNILIFLFLFCTFAPAFSQTLFIENFNYPVRDSLEGIGGWYRSGGYSPNKIKVISSSLSFAGYQGSGIGNSAGISNKPNSEILLNEFDPQSTGKVYMSFLMRVDSLTPAATEGYSICLDASGGSTNLSAKVYIKKLSSTTFNFGIKKCAGTTSYSSNVYSTNTTYLVIASYVFVPGSDNDTAKIYVSSAGVPATEPASPIASDKSNVDTYDLGEVVLSNSFIQTGLQNSSVKIDGIKVGTTWSNTLFGNLNLQLSLSALLQGFYNNVTNKMVKDTARVFLRYNSTPYTIADSSKAVLDSTGNGNFIFNRIGNGAPYYIVVKHRNSIETWSSTPKEFYLNILNFNFTNSAGAAYGSNMILKGAKYCFYSGDVNQDGLIDGTDGLLVDNAASVFLMGYVSPDVNGDNFVDGSDALITDNNAFNFVSVIRP